MVYRYALSKNPRMIAIPIMAVVLIVASLLILLLVHQLVGLIALLLSGFLAYLFVKAFLTSISSVVRISDEGLHATTLMGASYSVTWDEVTLAGVYSSPGAAEELFVYAEGEDNLFRIADTYTDRAGMLAELQSHCSKWLELSGDDPQGLVEQIRSRL
jgi:hypothetical protein